MIRTILLGIFCIIVYVANGAVPYWITAEDSLCNEPNTWIEFNKTFDIGQIDKDTVFANIAVDSKYWLWINDTLAIFEGGLKRGPNPSDTYFDRIDISPYLRVGENDMRILLCYFGKSGFSHIDSGRSGLFFEAQDINLVSDSTWMSRRLSAYSIAPEPITNFRLAESNIRYDANLSEKDKFKTSKIIGGWGDRPWNKLIERPIPQFRNYGMTFFPFQVDTLSDNTLLHTVKLPYNMQFTPYLELADSIGSHLVKIETDHVYGGGADCVRAEYITKPGCQTYESLGWMNGDILKVITSDNEVKIKNIGVRETGYDTEFMGRFCSNDSLIDNFWKKAMRTLYVNMRDNYFDCPDRERAQWWGDVTILMGQSFYQLSPQANHLMRKAIKELVDWQRNDGTLFSPVPAGNWNEELPAQMLASIGPYGFWYYYMHTGDIATMEYVYPAIKRYLSLWSLDDNDLTIERSGGWAWGDWGTDVDMRLLLACWHYMALQAAIDIANVTGNHDDIDSYQLVREKLFKGFNQNWDGRQYRHPDYKGATDDRVQALSILSGLADESKYRQLLEVLTTQWYASPYMEKYVMEALMKLKEGNYAIERFKKKFTPMIEDSAHSTLYEGWEEGGYGGGSTNHAWSGGMLTVIAENICGVRPVEPGWSRFEIYPYPVISECAIEIPTVKGMVKSSFSDTDRAFSMSVTVPDDTECILRFPQTKYKYTRINGKKSKDSDIISLPPGNYEIICDK